MYSFFFFEFLLKKFFVLSFNLFFFCLSIDYKSNYWLSFPGLGTFGTSVLAGRCISFWDIQNGLGGLKGSQKFLLFFFLFLVQKFADSYGYIVSAGQLEWLVTRYLLGVMIGRQGCGLFPEEHVMPFQHAMLVQFNVLSTQQLTKEL